MVQAGSGTDMVGNHVPGLFFYAACFGCAAGFACGAEGFSSWNGTAAGVSSLSGLWAQSYGDRPGNVHLYRNDANPWLQEFNVSLRAQYQAAAVSPAVPGRTPAPTGARRNGGG